MEKLRKKCEQLKTFLNPTDIYSSQRLVLIFLIFEGLFPFKIVGSPNNRVLRVSKIGYAVAVFHVIFYLTSFTITIWRYESFVLFFFPTEITRFGGHLQFFTSSKLMIVVYASCMYSANKIRVTMDNIHNIDGKLKLLDVEINHGVGFKMNIYSVIGLIIVNFTFSLMSFILLATADEVPGFAVWTSYFVPPLIVSIIVIHFFCIGFQIKQRFIGVNQVSKQIFIVQRTHFSVQRTLSSRSLY